MKRISRKKMGRPSQNGPFRYFFANVFYRIPCSSIACATFIKPAMLAPFI